MHEEKNRSILCDRTSQQGITVEGIHFFEFGQWSLEPLLGIKNSFLEINRDTVLYTWATISILALLLILFRYFFSRSAHIRVLTLSFIDFFIDLVHQTIGEFHQAHFFFVASLFIFIFLCNIISIIPGLDEPTKDVNTTFALGLIAFLYVQIVAIRAQGIRRYIGDYFKPLFFMVPLNVLGKLSTILSLSIRLFGNIFGGSIISTLYFTATQMAWWGPIISAPVSIVVMLFFTFFEGFLQAFVFMMLTLTYISLSMHQEGH